MKFISYYLIHLEIILENINNNDKEIISNKIIYN